MRLRLLIAATLTACSCGVATGDCPAPPDDEPFTFDEELSERTVHDMLAEQGTDTIADLDCEAVCISRYSEHKEVEANFSDTKSITACELELADEFTGNDFSTLGTIHCEGLEGFYAHCVGRRPLGHIEHPLADESLPAYLAHCARLEAASVHAFDQLADRLTAWRAPADLITRCRQAAREESTHAEILTALTPDPVAPPTQHDIPVDLAAAALDNAIAGCVHESWSALACAVTARHAATPELRAAYSTLAADEASHAQLAWDLHTWFMGQVTTFQRATIEAAQRSALADLPALAARQSRRAPPALALPDHRAAAHFAAALAA